MIQLLHAPAPGLENLRAILGAGCSKDGWLNAITITFYVVLFEITF